MKKNWNIGINSTIADLNDLYNDKRIEIPDYQRNYIWPQNARIMLIDSILQNYPIPKILVNKKIRDQKTHRIIIDGQQRLESIFSFLRDEFTLGDPYSGSYKGRKFSQLPDEAQNIILNYNLVIDEANDLEEKEVREVYARVNKYTMTLNDQELRKAEYPGDFLNLAEEIAAWEIFEDFKLFTPTSRRRMSDIEYISELLAALLNDGLPLEKKDDLDAYYFKFKNLTNSNEIKLVFENICTNIALLFTKEDPIYKTVFKQRADFYSLFLAINSALKKEGSIKGKEIGFLKEDLILFSNLKGPNCNIKEIKIFATKCLSDANSKSSRIWRTDFLYDIISGTYFNAVPTSRAMKRIYSIGEDLRYANSDFCPPNKECQICIQETNENLLMFWPKLGPFQINTIYWAHQSCAKKDYFEIKEPLD